MVREDESLDVERFRNVAGRQLFACATPKLTIKVQTPKSKFMIFIATDVIHLSSTHRKRCKLLSFQQYQMTTI